MVLELYLINTNYYQNIRKQLAHSASIEELLTAEHDSKSAKLAFEQCYQEGGFFHAGSISAPSAFHAYLSLKRYGMENSIRVHFHELIPRIISHNLRRNDFRELQPGDFLVERTQLKAAAKSSDQSVKVHQFLNFSIEDFDAEPDLVDQLNNMRDSYTPPAGRIEQFITEWFADLRKH